MINDEDKLSENIAGYEAGLYYITAAIWRTRIQGSLLDTFEIGIKRKSDGKFWLLQNRRFNHQSVQEVANAIAHLLHDAGENYDPMWCMDWFGTDNA